jgi:hypothetical protein
MKPYYGWLAIGLGVGIILLAIGQWTLWHRLDVQGKKLAIEIASSASNATAKVADPYAGIARDVQPIVANVPPAHQPYTPTRLEWLITELNAEHKSDQLGFQIFFMPPDNDDPQTIKLVLMCNSKTDPKVMLNFVEAMHKNIELKRKLVGWEWLKIKEVYVQTKEDDSEKYPGLKPYTPTRLEWFAAELNAISTSQRGDLGDVHYQILFAPSKSDTIILLVQYTDDVDRINMSNYVELNRKLAEKIRGNRGWTWLQIKEEYKYLDVGKAP